jgi:hypothetical protein
VVGEAKQSRSLQVGPAPAGRNRPWDSGQLSRIASSFGRIGRQPRTRGHANPSEANLDRDRVAALSRAKALTEPRRRHALIYLLASAIIALAGTDAFSNPGHKQVASHRSKAAKAENPKHRAAHRHKTAKAENHKHQSSTEVKHSERAPGPRILLPRDPTSAGDLIPAPLPSSDLAEVKQAIRQHFLSAASSVYSSSSSSLRTETFIWEWHPQMLA